VRWRKRQCEFRNLGFPLQFIKYIVDRLPLSSSSLSETSAKARQGIDVTGVLSWGFRFAHRNTNRTQFRCIALHRSMIIRVRLLQGEV
jgi:hypothetical protein